MRAHTGDWLVIRSSKVDYPDHRGRILGVGPGGAPPFRVRWSHDDHESLVVPGPDAQVVAEEEVRG